jgi:hypothetical protein
VEQVPSSSGEAAAAARAAAAGAAPRSGDERLQVPQHVVHLALQRRHRGAVWLRKAIHGAADSSRSDASSSPLAAMASRAAPPLRAGSSGTSAAASAPAARRLSTAQHLRQRRQPHVGPAGERVTQSQKKHQKRGRVPRQAGFAGARSTGMRRARAPSSPASMLKVK